MGYLFIYFLYIACLVLILPFSALVYDPCTLMHSFWEGAINIRFLLAYPKKKWKTILIKWMMRALKCYHINYISSK